MNGLYASPGASQILVSQSVTLANPLTVDNVTLFRHTVYLIVPVDDVCDGVVLHPNAQLTVHFSPVPVSITHTSSAWNRSSWRYEDARVEVDLALPVRIQRLNSDGYGQAALHRMDGDKLIEEPTVVVATNKAIAEDFVASRFAMAFSGTVLQPNATIQSAMMSAPSAMNAATPISMVQGSQKTKAKKKAGGNAGLVQEAQQNMQEMLQVIYGYTLDAIVVQGQPTSPRMRLMNPENTESLWQWLEFAGVQSEPRSVTVTASQLQPALDRAFATRADGVQSLVLPLILESDAPCHLQLQSQHFSFKRQANLLTGGEPLSLRFSSGQIDTQTLSLQAPDVVPEALALGFTVAKTEDTATAIALPTASSLAKIGFRLQAGDHLAVPIDLVSGVFVCGESIPWWPLDSVARLKLSLHADQGGIPASAAWVTTDLAIEGEEPSWLMFRWPELQLQPGRYWLQLAVEDGIGLWLANNIATQLHRHCVQTGPEMISVPQTPLHYPLQDAGAQSAVATLNASLNGTPIAFAVQDGQVRASLQPLPAKPWVLQLQMARGGLVTVNEETLWY